MCLIFFSHIRVRATHNISVVLFCELTFMMCARTKRIMLLPQIHLLCLPYLWLYPEFIKAFFLCPAASSFFIWCSLCGYLESYSVQKKVCKYRKRHHQTAMLLLFYECLSSDVVTLYTPRDLFLYRHKMLHPPVCLWLVYPEAKPFLIFRPRQRQTGPLQKEIAEVCFQTQLGIGQ